MILSIVALLVAPGRAAADPVADKRAEAAALAQQINAEGHQVEVLAEQYNGAQYHLAEVQKQLAGAQDRLAATRVDVERNRAALADEAVVAYMHGGATATPTMSRFSGSVDLAVQQGYFQLATNNQADALDQLRKSEQALHQEQLTLQAAQQDSQAAVAAVASRQHAVQAAQADSQATLNKVQGDLVQLVADQQAQIAAQQQAQLQASLLAAKAKLTATAPKPVAPTPTPAAAAPAEATTVAPALSVLGAGRTTTTQAGPPPPGAPPPVPNAPAPSKGAAAAVAYARAQIGKPYQWAAAGPDSFDCSGLTMRAWEAGGVSLPHYARGQYANTAHVAIADLQPGDLVFFGSDLHHVGLYIGGGQMIDAPQTGEFVRVDTIFWSDLQPFGGRPG